jgi:cysteine-rich repeat protein/parallel beta-helix repeat protein
MEKMSEKRKEMKLKASKLLLISLVAVIFSLAGALAANCGGATTCHCGDTVTSSYNLNGNMNCVGNALVIGANGITLNCKGYTISGNGGGYGVYVAAKGNVIIKNCKINSFETGVWPSGSYNVEVNNVSVSNCVVFGVNVDVSSDIKLYNVNLSYNHAGLGASGCFSVINATLNNNNQIGIVTDGGQGCTVLIKNVEVSYNQAGISLYHFDNTLFSNVTVIGNGQFGIILNDANGNIIENSYIANNQYAGVYVYTFSSGNIIRSSNISSNSNAGILLSGSANTQITNSTISGNTNAGISFATGTDNNQIIYHNNILGSPIKINFSSCPSSGTNLAALFGGGNFWGHSSAPLFISSSDTNCAGLTDSQAYNSLDGWRLGEPSNQDTDNDGIQDADDNCPQNYNPDQLDSDFDGKGDLCDPCPFSSPDNCDSLYTRAANINPTTGATLSNGEVWLNIPAGAVNTDTSISIQRGGQSNFNVVNDLGGGIAIYEYVFGPRGKNFNSLYTLKFAYNPGEYLCDIGFCSVWFCRPGESRETCWEPVDTDYSEIGWLTIKDSHFSEFAPMQKIESAVIQSTIIGQGETGDVGFAAITPAEITSFQYSVIYPKGLIFRGYSLSSRINPYWAAAINVTDAGCAEGSECEFNQVNIYVSTKPGGTIYGTEGSLIDLQFDAAPDTASGAYNLTVSNILMLDANSQPIETGYVSNGVAYVDNNPPELTVHGIPQSWQNNAALIGIECDDCAKIEYGVSSLPICFATSKYTAPVQITSNKWFCWRGEDAAGNTASGTSKIDYFDSDAPVTSASIEGQITDGKYYNKATVIISTENDMSGVETTVYCVDNTDECDPLTTYNMQFDVNNEGVNFVRYYSIDNAGNTEEIKSARFEITKEVLPEEHLTITTSGTQGNNGWFTSIVGWIVEACSNFGVRGLNSSIELIGGSGGPVCGNSFVETGEQCDDGNTVSGDGCSSTCTIEAVPTCGAAGSDTEGMIGYWEMEENTGASTADSSGLGHTLTGNGRTFPAWTTLGKVTNALSNAGSWETAAGTGDSSFNFNGEHIITVEAWVKFVSWNWGGWAYQLGNQPWSFYANGAAPNTGKAVMYYDGVLGATNSNTVMDLNTWYYIVSTYDGANAILYINGNVDKTVPATGNMAASSTDLALGFGLDGIMDEVAIYNRALSLQDVQAHYSRSSAGNHYC